VRFHKLGGANNRFCRLITLIEKCLGAKPVIELVRSLSLPISLREPFRDRPFLGWLRLDSFGCDGFMGGNPNGRTEISDEFTHWSGEMLRQEAQKAIPEILGLPSVRVLADAIENGFENPFEFRIIHVSPPQEVTQRTTKVVVDMR
jgi:hypothetical protein